MARDFDMLFLRRGVPITVKAVTIRRVFHLLTDIWQMKEIL